MRRMGERRPTKNPLPGMTMGLLLVFLVSTFVIWHQNKLVKAVIGERKVQKVIADDHPNAEERDFLKTLISQVGGK